MPPCHIQPSRNSGLIKTGVLISMLFAASYNSSTRLQGPGTIDHVGVAVHDLDTAGVTYENTLGFLPAQRTRLENGIESLTFWFRDTTYLELLTYYDKTRARWVERFLEHGEGGIFFAVRVSDIDRKAEQLQARGLLLERPRAIPAQIEGIDEILPEIFRVVLIAEPPPSFPAFFIGYDREEIERLNATHPELSPMRFTGHPNSAIGLSAVWIRVTNTDSAASVYRLMGFEPGRSLTMPVIGERAREVPAGPRSFLLIESTGKSGALAGMRTDGIAGASIEVGSLDTARALLRERTHMHFDSYDGIRGESVLIPASMAHGIWLEFFEQRKE